MGQVELHLTKPVYDIDGDCLGKRKEMWDCSNALYNPSKSCLWLEDLVFSVDPTHQWSRAYKAKKSRAPHVTLLIWDNYEA